MRWRLKVALIRMRKPAWQVARDLGLRADYLSRITSGAITPSPELMSTIAQHLGCPEAELFEDTSEVDSERVDQVVGTSGEAQGDSASTPGDQEELAPARPQTRGTGTAR